MSEAIRTTDTTTRVYWNLHHKVWSLKVTGEPVKHADRVVLTSCRLTVSEPGRRRVLATKRKNVHAFVRGVVMGEEFDEYNLDEMVEVTCNPYKYNSFVRKDTGEPVAQARIIVMTETGKVYAAI